MAAVYEGSRLTGFDYAPVAIKRLQDNFKDDKAITGRFLQEGMLGLELAHHHLAKIFELDRDQAGDLRIVMERINGVALDDLGEIIQPHPRLIRTVLCVLFEVASYLHNCNVFHRDISPRNIINSKTGIVKLFDLGHARDLDRPASAPGPFKGTAAFASPIAIRCEEYTAGSDVYSIGTIGYWLLTGRPPYGTGRHPEISRRMQISQIAPLPDDTPDDLRHVIMESLHSAGSSAQHLAWQMMAALDQDTEPLATARELADIVAPFMPPDVVAHEQTADYQPPAGSKPRRTIAGFAVAMACLLISAVGWRFWLDSRPSANGTTPTQTTAESRSDAPTAHQDMASDPAPEPTEQHGIDIRQLSTTSTTDAEPRSRQPSRTTTASNRAPARSWTHGEETDRDTGSP